MGERPKMLEVVCIKTLHSVYEVRVYEGGTTICRKVGVGNRWHQVRASDTSYLEMLCIGVRFNVPGVVETSLVQNYERWIRNPEPKRHSEDEVLLEDMAAVLMYEVAEFLNPGYDGPV